MADAFFVREDENTFVSTDHTRGPWNPDAQHAGPTSALIGRAIELVGGRNDVQVARVTYEILRPIPVEPVTVTAEVIRPGQKVELIEATLSASGKEIIRARAWRIRTTELDLEVYEPKVDPPPGRDLGRREESFGDVGYLKAMETLFVEGSFLEVGPACAWFRMRHPLVEGEETSPLCRVLIAADSGNGISASLDWSKWLFINPDLSVYLHRLPRSEWICMAATTWAEQKGIGLAASTIFDEQGHIGGGMQSLYVGPR
ncbi:MAG TPA: thioesterase family protein [Actinomycetota bacterium]|nr:thioesterase family protein [Actinomycetota bacterium]